MRGGNVSNKIKWPGGKTAPFFRKEVAALSDEILNGKLLAIDPASRSAGFAFFEAGELVRSGVIEMGGRSSITDRLKVLYQRLSEEDPVDLLAVEKIRGSGGHIYLTWAVGTTVAGAPSNKLLEIPTYWWKAMAAATPGYVKSDEQDAIVMGTCLITLAREMKEEENSE